MKKLATVIASLALIAGVLLHTSKAPDKFPAPVIPVAQEQPTEPHTELENPEPKNFRIIVVRTASGTVSEVDVLKFIDAQNSNKTATEFAPMAAPKPLMLGLLLVILLCSVLLLTNISCVRLD